MSAPESMHRAYVEAALFSSTDDDDRPLDYEYSAIDFAPEARMRMRHDVDSFYRVNQESINSYDEVYLGPSRYEKAGHDFWLTRNRHGSGFWDGDWPEPAATRLTESAHAFGEQDIYVGDDGLLHVTGEHEMLAAVFTSSDGDTAGTAAKVALGAVALAALGFGWYIATSNKIA